MSGSPTSPGDDGVRNANSSIPTPPITPLLAAKLKDLSKPIAAGIRQVVSRKGHP